MLKRWAEDRKSRKFLYQFNSFLLLSIVSLYHLPGDIGARIVGHYTDASYRINYAESVLVFLLILFFLGSVFFNLVFWLQNRSGNNIDRSLLFVFILYTLIWTSSIIRTAVFSVHLGTVTTIGYLILLFLFVVFVMLAFSNASQENAEGKKYLRTIFYSLGIFVILNLILFLIGIEPSEQIYLREYPAQILSLVGISVSRVLFPMAWGINSFGLMAGVALMGLLPLVLGDSRLEEKLAASVMGISCLAVMLLTDSRGGILFAVITMVLIYLPYKLFVRAIWLPFFVSALPIALTLFAPSFFDQDISWLNRPEAQGTERSAYIGQDETCEQLLAESSGALSNRPIIWNVVIDELRDWKSIHLIGYGYQGQYPSEISYRYACLFASYEHGELASVHNLWFQTLVDVGYVGFTLTLILLGLLFTRLSNALSHRENPIIRGMTAALMYTLLIGTLEASLSPDFIGHFLVFLFVLVVFIQRVPYYTQDLYDQ